MKIYPKETKLSTREGIAYEPSVDGLRAIAIFGVIFFHIFPKYIPGGFVGVDIFFVISGYIITKVIFDLIERAQFNLLEFYFARIRRIFPALLITLISAWLLGYFFLFSEEFKRLSKQIFYSTIFLNNFIYNNEINYFDSYAKLNPLLHLWSLALEFQFYLIYPIFLAIIYKLKYRTQIIIGLSILSFIYNIYFLEENMNSFYLPYGRIWEFLLGAIIVEIQFQKAKNNLDQLYKKDKLNNLFKFLVESMPFFGFIVVFISYLNIQNSDNFPGFLALLPCIGAMMLLMTNSSSMVLRVLLKNSWITYFGKISYPLYLWHWVFISFGKIVINEEIAQIFLLYLIIFAIFISMLTYHLIEKPIRGGAFKIRPHFWLVALSILVSAVGYLTYLNDGLVNRKINMLTKNNQFDEPYKQSCEAITGMTFSDDRCFLKQNQSQGSSIFMIGDSFSNSYSTIIYEFLQKTDPKINLLQFGRGQCPMILNYGPQFCQDFTKNVFSAFPIDAKSQKILIAIAWSDYISGKNWGRRYNNFSESKEEFQSKFIETIEYLQNKNFQIIIMFMIPDTANPKSCIDRFQKIYLPCDISKKDVIQNENKYKNILLSYIPGKEIKYYDPIPYLCNEVECLVRLDDNILYNDARHLSTVGGKFLAQKSYDALSDLLK